MHDAPSAKELIEAVKSFIDKTAAPQLTGHAAFHARVPRMRSPPCCVNSDRPPLKPPKGPPPALLGTSGATANDLNQKLCEEIRAGRMDLATEGLLSHLKSTTIDQLSVDQPGYSGLKTAAR